MISGWEILTDMISSEVMRATIGAESSVQSPRTAQGRAHQARAEVQNPESRVGFGVGCALERRRSAESQSPDRPRGREVRWRSADPEFRVGNPLEGAQVKECKGSEMSN